ncbi:MAG TPA: DUF3618 domain-containing protein [Longimicrobium sp.]|nr:DUF3618 domain-containing protein [Longimicrobium sp.]
MAEIRNDQDGDDRTLLRGPAPGPVSGLPEAAPPHAVTADGLGSARDVPPAVHARPVTDPDHLLPEHAGRGVPGMVAATDDPEVVREEIERTRQRMSSTIDSIEEVLLRKKERIEERLDVTAPVRRAVRDNPWPIVGGVFGAALTLGWLTGGDEREARVRKIRRATAAARKEREETRGAAVHDAEWRERSLQWERRARTLMKTCHRQEEEIEHLREAIGEARPEGGGWTSAVADSVSGFVSSLFGGRGGEREYVVELEEPRARSTVAGSEYGATSTRRGPDGFSGDVNTSGGW